jgi:hypothetical protein
VGLSWPLLARPVTGNNRVQDSGLGEYAEAIYTMSELPASKSESEIEK